MPNALGSCCWGRALWRTLSNNFGWVMGHLAHPEGYGLCSPNDILVSGFRRCAAGGK